MSHHVQLLITLSYRTGPILLICRPTATVVWFLCSQITPNVNKTCISKEPCGHGVPVGTQVECWVWPQASFWQLGPPVRARGGYNAFGGDRAPSSGEKENSTSILRLRWPCSHLCLFLIPSKWPHISHSQQGATSFVLSSRISRSLPVISYLIQSLPDFKFENHLIQAKN